MLSERYLAERIRYTSKLAPFVVSQVLANNCRQVSCRETVVDRKMSTVNGANDLQFTGSTAYLKEPLLGQEDRSCYH